MAYKQISALALSSILLLTGISFGQLSTAEEACNSLKTNVRSGAEPRAALRDILKTKPEFCPIIQCALEIGIPLRAVHLAARDACEQDCNVSRCTSYACRQTEKLFDTDEACKAIKTEIDKGRDASVVTLEKIRQGHKACTVLMCTVAAGGDLDGVIRAARELNISDDVISRCCVDGCADPYRVAQLLREYNKPTPPDDPKKPAYLSPSGF